METKYQSCHARTRILFTNFDFCCGENKQSSIPSKERNPYHIHFVQERCTLLLIPLDDLTMTTTTTIPSKISYTEEADEQTALASSQSLKISSRRKPKKQALQMVVTGGSMYKGEWQGDQFMGRVVERTDKEQTGTWVNGVFITDNTAATAQEEQELDNSSRRQKGLRKRLNNLKKHLAL